MGWNFDARTTFQVLFNVVVVSNSICVAVSIHACMCNL
jgi:hypothetical protein